MINNEDEIMPTLYMVTSQSQKKASPANKHPVEKLDIKMATIIF